MARNGVNDKKKAAPPNRLKELREKGVWLTQEEVAAIVGVDVTTVSKHETGGRGLDDKNIIAYAKLYKVRTHELFMDTRATDDQST